MRKGVGYVTRWKRMYRRSIASQTLSYQIMIAKRYQKSNQTKPKEVVTGAGEQTRSASISGHIPLVHLAELTRPQKQLPTFGKVLLREKVSLLPRLDTQHQLTQKPGLRQ
jgi:hypothetical protein